MTDEPSAPTLQEQIAWYRDYVKGLETTFPDMITPPEMYAILATMEAQPARDAVIEAARNLGEAMNNAQDCDAKFRALWTALDLADATALPPVPDKEG